MKGIHIDSHISNILGELVRANKAKCNLVQLFVDPMTKQPEIYNQFALLLKRLKMNCVVHASYTINCSKEWDQYSWWLREFIMEIQLAHKIGAIGIVIHLGKQLKLSIQESLNNMFTSLAYIASQTKNFSEVKILIETSSGQGSELCYGINDLAHFYSKIKKSKFADRFGICVDTCHIFVSGHDIRSPKLLKQYMMNFDKLIGLDEIKLIHLNDSKNDLGSKVDRHENLGYGFIGKKNLIEFIKFFYNIKIQVPIVLETPNLKQAEDIKILIKK